MKWSFKLEKSSPSMRPFSNSTRTTSQYETRSTRSNWWRSSSAWPSDWTSRRLSWALWDKRWSKPAPGWTCTTNSCCTLTQRWACLDSLTRLDNCRKRRTTFARLTWCSLTSVCSTTFTLRDCRACLWRHSTVRVGINGSRSCSGKFLTSSQTSLSTLTGPQVESSYWLLSLAPCFKRLLRTLNQSIRRWGEREEDLKKSKGKSYSTSRMIKQSLTIRAFASDWWST